MTDLASNCSGSLLDFTFITRLVLHYHSGEYLITTISRFYSQLFIKTPKGGAAAKSSSTQVRPLSQGPATVSVFLHFRFRCSRINRRTCPSGLLPASLFFLFGSAHFSAVNEFVKKPFPPALCHLNHPAAEDSKAFVCPLKRFFLLFGRGEAIFFHLMKFFFQKLLSRTRSCKRILVWRLSPDEPHPFRISNAYIDISRANRT
jgi:hypothetical protein